MQNSTVNTILLAIVTLLVAGTGFYLTRVEQPEEIQEIEHRKKLARLQRAEVSQLLAEEAASQEMADQAVRKWQARYKFIPAKLSTPDIVVYLEGLTSRGFETFDIELADVKTQPDFSIYRFKINGTAFFKYLYHFVWHLENNREFYRVGDLQMRHTNVFKENPETGLRKRLDMVSFSMTLDAYFNGAEGLSASSPDSLMPVPELLLPAHYPTENSFYPVVRTDLPPNDEQLLNMEEATLVSLLGDRAVLDDSNGRHILREGDKVYLGQIVKIDPVKSLVRASLNKGGVTEIVDVVMESAKPAYEQAKGETQLVPAGDPNRENNKQNQR